MSKKMDRLIWSLFTVVPVRGEVAEVAIRSIEANLPYVNDPATAEALERCARILDEQVVLADDYLWQELTHGRVVPTD